MKKLLLIMFCMLACFAQAQQVTKTVHKKAVKTDVVTTGTMTIRKPDYICISTDNDRDLLMMDGTKFTITIGSKRHTTDSRNNPQFTTFHEVLTAVINGQPIPQSDDMTITTKNGQKTITITPVGKKRQLFSSFVLVLDAKTSNVVQLRMNERGENYINYDFK
jgi:hypothetical protein